MSCPHEPTGVFRDLGDGPFDLVEVHLLLLLSGTLTYDQHPRERVSNLQEHVRMGILLIPHHQYILTMADKRLNAIGSSRP